MLPELSKISGNFFAITFLLLHQSPNIRFINSKHDHENPFCQTTQSMEESEFSSLGSHVNPEILVK